MAATTGAGCLRCCGVPTGPFRARTRSGFGSGGRARRIRARGLAPSELSTKLAKIKTANRSAVRRDLSVCVVYLKHNDRREVTTMTGSALITPVNGMVNVGGGHETPNMTNLNPIKSGSGGPARGIPNHVQGSMEEMDQIFRPGSVEYIISSRLRFDDVNWAHATRAAAKVMRAGARVEMNIWCQTNEAALVMKEFEQAGFSDVTVTGQGVGTMIRATR
jgi:hypothetical protein